MKRNEIIKLLEEAAIKLGDIKSSNIVDRKTNKIVTKISRKEIDAMQTALICCMSALEHREDTWDANELISNMFFTHVATGEMADFIKSNCCKGCGARD